MPRPQFKDISPFIGPACALGFALFQRLPLGLSVVVALYVVLAFGHLVMSWRYCDWESSRDESTAHFTKMFALFHRVWVVTMLIVPLFAVLIYATLVSMPKWADYAADSFLDDIHAVARVEHTMIQVDRVPSGDLEEHKVYVAARKDGKTYLAPGDRVFELAMHPFLSFPLTTALVVWILLIVLLGALRLTEAIGEKVYGLRPAAPGGTSVVA